MFSGLQHTACPKSGADMPLPHGEHCSDPGDSAYVFTSHGRHDGHAAALAYVPGAQALHTESPGLADVPAAHTQGGAST